MAKIRVAAPEGTRDRLFGACAARRNMENRARTLYARFGYGEVMTPALELFDLFSRTGLPLPSEAMCKLIDRDGRILAMRPDSTAPMARVAAARLAARPMPLRLHYIQDIYRSDDRHTGRRLETRQAGVELLGAGGRKADLEILALASETLAALGAPDFRIELGHAALFRALAGQLNASPEEVEKLRALIQSKNFAALGDRLSGYEDRPVCEAIGRLCTLFGGMEVFEDAGRLGVPEADQALDDLRDTYAALASAGFGGRIHLDLGLVHQMEYYTGVVFRGYVSGVGHAVLTGGRYDNLMGTLGSPAPATGFAVDLDALCERDNAPEPLPPDTLIHFSAGRLAAALSELNRRPSGHCELSPCETVEESTVLAAARGMKTLIVMGDDTREVNL